MYRWQLTFWLLLASFMAGALSAGWLGAAVSSRLWPGCGWMCVLLVVLGLRRGPLLVTVRAEFSVRRRSVSAFPRKIRSIVRSLLVILAATGLGHVCSVSVIRSLALQSPSEPYHADLLVQVQELNEGQGPRWRQVVEVVQRVSHSSSTSNSSPDSSPNSIPNPQPMLQAGQSVMLGLSFNDRQQETRVQQLAQQMRPGELWRVSGRLTAVPSVVSPGVFDQRQWLWSRGITARLTISDLHRVSPNDSKLCQPNTIQCTYTVIINNWRLYYRKRLRSLFDTTAQPMQVSSGVLLGLLTGDRSAISVDLGQLYQRMGISHLLAISGPHIVWFGVLCGWLARQFGNRWQRRRFRGGMALYQRLPRPQLNQLVMLTGAMAYAQLAGWDIPAQRTVLMLALVCLVRWLCIAVHGWQLGLLLLLVQWLIDPLCGLNAAFWLSYGAVCIVVLADRTVLTIQTSDPKIQRSAKSAEIDSLPAFYWRLWNTLSRQLRRGWALLAQQWLVMLGLIPLSTLIFGSFSLQSFVVNLIAIPLFGLILVPLDLSAALMDGVFPRFAGTLWQWDAAVLSHWHEMLRWLLRVWDAPLQHWDWSGGTAVCLLGILIVLMLPKGAVSRLWLLPLSMPIVLACVRPVTLPAPLRVTAMDVAQGHSVLIRTAHHSLLMGIGVSGGSGPGRTPINPEQRVSESILPVLTREGIQRLDRIVVTGAVVEPARKPALKSALVPLVVQRDPQVDTRLSWGALLTHWRPDSISLADTVLISELARETTHAQETFAVRTMACRSGDSWEWDSVRFAFLDTDCTLAVSVPEGLKSVGGRKFSSTFRGGTLTVRAASARSDTLPFTPSPDTEKGPSLSPSTSTSMSIVIEPVGQFRGGSRLTVQRGGSSTPMDTPITQTTLEEGTLQFDWPKAGKVLHIERWRDQRLWWYDEVRDTDTHNAAN